jgi:colanic acid biosynthesis glycosyl transferase WcaI
MHMLLLIIQFPPDTNPTGRLMAQVGEGLLDYGHRVSVITAVPHYAEFRIWQEYRGKLQQRDVYRGLDVLRLWVYASGSKQRMLHRLASYLSYNALATLATLASRQRYDVMLCPNGSFFTGIAAFVAGTPKRIPFIYNVQDLYPDVPVKAGQLRNRQAIAALEQMERFMYRRSAHISVITPSFRDTLVAKDVPAEKVSVIPNFVDTDFIRPLAGDNAFRRQQGLEGKFVVMHAGNLGYVYDLGTLLDVADRLRHLPDLVFLIVGEGVARPELQQKARALQLANVRFLPFQPLEMLPWMRATADVQVSLYKAGAASDSMPSKVYEIMASGRPVLASADIGSDVRRLITQCRCGICVDPQQAEQLQNALLTLYHNPDLRATMGEYGRRHAEQSYSKQVVTRQYHDLLCKVGKF